MDIDNIIEQAAAGAPDKAGRKNKGISKLHKQINNKFLYDEGRRVFNAPNSPEPPVEKLTGEIIDTDNLEQFRDYFLMQCNDTLTDFKANNPELIKKHVYNWHKQLLIELKHNTPRVGPEELDKLIIVWDCLKELLYYIGLYPTFELFSIFTGVYKYQLENRWGLNPKYIEFKQKITADVNNGLINDLHNNPFNQTNKIFLAKTRGIIEQTAPKTIEVKHQITNYDDISSYRLDKKE